MGLTLTLCRMTYAVQNGLKVVPTAQLPAYIPLGYMGCVMLHPWFRFVLFSRSPVVFIAYNPYPNMYAASVTLEQHGGCKRQVLSHATPSNGKE